MLSSPFVWESYSLHSCESYIVSQCGCQCGITYFINPPIIPSSPFWEPYSTPIILDSFNTKNLIPNTLYKRVTSRKTQKFATLLACNAGCLKGRYDSASFPHFGQIPLFSSVMPMVCKLQQSFLQCVTWRVVFTLHIDTMQIMLCKKVQWYVMHYALCTMLYSGKSVLHMQ